MLSEQAQRPEVYSCALELGVAPADDTVGVEHRTEQKWRRVSRLEYT
jgi:hypothetical protein